jgi:hypothetical protein
LVQQAVAKKSLFIENQASFSPWGWEPFADYYYFSKT